MESMHFAGARQQGRAPRRGEGSLSGFRQSKLGRPDEGMASGGAVLNSFATLPDETQTKDSCHDRPKSV